MPLATTSMQRPQGVFGSSAPQTKFKPLASPTGFNAAPHQQSFSGVKIDMNASQHQQQPSLLKPGFNASLHQQEFAPSPVFQYVPVSSSKKPRTSTETTGDSEHLAESFAAIRTEKKKKNTLIPKSRNNSTALAAPGVAGDMDANAPSSPAPTTATKKWLCC
ncbi:hypothetical protein BASA81_007098 [Batrachochytrium salamandrivorans]|nr:hypothetical protein BASA81_007098 [Batrachochytrium salamandrivorans]